MPPINSIAQQIRLVNQWLPLLSFGQRYLAETDHTKRALVIGDAAEWLASKTENRLDDLLVDDVVSILKTPQGEKLVRDLVSLGQAAAAAADGVQS